MPGPEPELCGKCGIRVATNHVCIGGTGKSFDLCDECIVTESPTAASFAAEAKVARCRYCGGQPCSGNRERWMCFSCAAEYYSVLAQAFKPVSANLPQAGQMDEIGKILDEADAHMRAFVRQRDN